jgi:hypothetical protein
LLTVEYGIVKEALIIIKPISAIAGKTVTVGWIKSAAQLISKHAVTRRNVVSRSAAKAVVH